MSNKGKGSKSKSHIESLNINGLYNLINSDKLYGYREFCRILEIPILSSGSASQDKQLKELSMICEYEKENRKYHFIRMRTEDEIMLYNERAIYSPLIEYIISEKFCSEQCSDKMVDGILFLSMPQLLVWTGMVNENFNEIRTGDQAYETRMAVHFINRGKFNTGDLKMFVNVSYKDILKPIMRDALKSLDNKKSITIQKGFKLFVKNIDGHILYKPVTATSSIGKEILHICAEVFTELGIKNTRELYTNKRNLSRSYYERCNEICSERLGYDGFYDCYAIIVDKSRTRYNMNVLQNELNKRIRDRIRNAKQLNSLSVKSKENMIDAVIALNTQYDFKDDRKKYIEMIRRI